MAGKTLPFNGSGTDVQAIFAAPLGGAMTRTVTVIVDATGVKHFSNTSAGTAVVASRVTVPATAATYYFDIGPGEALWCQAAGITNVNVWHPAS